MNCPCCDVELELTVTCDDPPLGVALAPTQVMTLTCPECGYAETERKVIDGEAPDRWIESRSSLQERLREFREEKERDLEDGNTDVLRTELARLNGYLDALERGEVADVVANIEFCAQKARVLEQLLKRGARDAQG